jgi:lipopolysaccharide/colanic/teichoic acid biosynthesis glycosyltransferase
VNRSGGTQSMRPSNGEDRTHVPGGDILSEDAFRRMICLERKRTERSRKPFVLMLVDTGDTIATDRNGHVLLQILHALAFATRETDVRGWYTRDLAVGVMFTEITLDDKKQILSTMLERVNEALRHHLTFEQFNQIKLSFHLFPEDWDHQSPEGPQNRALYPDLAAGDVRKPSRMMKRAMDIVGSFLALLVFSPLFFLISTLVKLTSKGPVLFRQQRVGQYGKPFTFLKFRSMYVNNDAEQHKTYVKQLIAGQAVRNGTSEGSKGVFKIVDDPRVTRIGKFLRRTSLDELPQFWNVLAGDMSLVGPRPPITYEVEAYDLWHRRRLLEAKPGITGLWQVNGRSKVEFDEMVRLDLQYAKTWSPWLDIKILARTPKAMVAGEGAY